MPGRNCKRKAPNSRSKPAPKRPKKQNRPKQKKSKPKKNVPVHNKNGPEKNIRCCSFFRQFGESCKKSGSCHCCYFGNNRIPTDCVMLSFETQKPKKIKNYILNDTFSNFLRSTSGALSLHALVFLSGNDAKRAGIDWRKRFGIKLSPLPQDAILKYNLQDGIPFKHKAEGHTLKIDIDGKEFIQDSRDDWRQFFHDDLLTDLFQAERDQCQTERDQLQAESNQFQSERDQSQAEGHRLQTELDQLQARIQELENEREIWIQQENQQDPHMTQNLTFPNFLNESSDSQIIQHLNLGNCQDTLMTLNRGGALDDSEKEDANQIIDPNSSTLDLFGESFGISDLQQGTLPIDNVDLYNPQYGDGFPSYTNTMPFQPLLSTSN